jgi:hypothetical protein
MRPLAYLKGLFLLLFLLIALAIAYAYYFSKHYPLPITDRISLDAKLKFVRENVAVDSVDTMIVGSSIGLNNILGEVLAEKSERIHSAVNFSVYEATALQAEQLTHLSDTFPNLKRIIYSAQYSDFPHARKYEDFHRKLWVKYMRRELNIVDEWLIFFRACRNILFCMQRQMAWEGKHMQDNRFEYLGFDRSGSVPLNIYGDDIIGHRWRNPHPGIMSGASFEAVARMADRAKAKGIKFYLAHQPYRQGIYEKSQKVRGAMGYFDTKVQEALDHVEWGELVVLQEVGLGDAYFSDRTHLNDQGSAKISEALAKVIDQKEQKE